MPQILLSWRVVKTSHFRLLSSILGGFNVINLPKEHSGKIWNPCFISFINAYAHRCISLIDFTLQLCYAIEYNRSIQFLLMAGPYNFESQQPSLPFEISIIKHLFGTELLCDLLAIILKVMVFESRITIQKKDRPQKQFVSLKYQVF